MTNPNEMLRDRLSSAFLRKGGAGSNHTKIFDELDDAQKTALITLSSMALTELPILGSHTDQENWLIFTAKRLVWRTKGITHELLTSTIVDAYIESREMKIAKETGAGLCTLFLRDVHGSFFQVPFESGHAIIGALNCFMGLCRINKGRMNKAELVGRTPTGHPPHDQAQFA